MKFGCVGFSISSVVGLLFSCLSLGEDLNGDDGHQNREKHEATQHYQDQSSPVQPEREIKIKVFYFNGRTQAGSAMPGQTGKVEPNAMTNLHLCFSVLGLALGRNNFSLMSNSSSSLLLVKGLYSLCFRNVGRSGSLVSVLSLCLSKYEDFLFFYKNISL